jgi:osmoprotectant transport system substrate-binding protein
LQQADNLVPVVNADSAGDEAVADALNQLADVLTTEDLAELNARVDRDRELAEDVARDYLEEQGLI